MPLDSAEWRLINESTRQTVWFTWAAVQKFQKKILTTRCAKFTRKASSIPRKHRNQVFYAAVHRTYDFFYESIGALGKGAAIDLLPIESLSDVSRWPLFDIQGESPMISDIVDSRQTDFRGKRRGNLERQNVIYGLVMSLYHDNGSGGILYGVWRRWEALPVPIRQKGIV